MFWVFSTMTRFARKLAIASLPIILALQIGCAPKKAENTPVAVAPAQTSFALSINGKAFQAELAVSDLERAKGLMYRKSLVPNSGMLFVSAPAPQSFWMKNTQIALDLGYFTADGILREIKPLFPFVLDSVPSARDDIALCLEMPQGWFADQQLTPGMQLDMKAVRKALQARGFEPSRFGL